jgi:hypothetical protein
MKHVLLKRPSFSPLYLRIFFKNVFMFERKTSCMVGSRRVLHDMFKIGRPFWVAKEVHHVTL